MWQDVAELDTLSSDIENHQKRCHLSWCDSWAHVRKRAIIREWFHWSSFTGKLLPPRVQVPSLDKECIPELDQESGQKKSGRPETRILCGKSGIESQRLFWSTITHSEWSWCTNIIQCHPTSSHITLCFISRSTDLPHHIRIRLSCKALVFRPCRIRGPIVSWQQSPVTITNCYCWPLLTIVAGHSWPFSLSIIHHSCWILLAMISQPLL